MGLDFALRMRWRRLAALCAFGAGVYLASQTLWLQVARAADQQPFHILLRDRILVADTGSFREMNRGNHIYFLRARRADGSRAELTFERFRDWADFQVMNKKLFLAPTATLVTSLAQSNTKSTSYLSGEEAVALQQGRADRSCRTNSNLVGQPEFLGYGEHLGYRVAKHRLSSQTARTEIWEAVDLDCEAVWIRTDFLGRGGAVSDSTLREAVRIERAEAPGFLFAEDSFAEAPPSGLLGVNHQAAPEIAEKVRRLDEAYYRRRRAQ